MVIHSYDNYMFHSVVAVLSATTIKITRIKKSPEKLKSILIQAYYKLLTNIVHIVKLIDL